MDDLRFFLYIICLLQFAAFFIGLSLIGDLISMQRKNDYLKGGCESSLGTLNIQYKLFDLIDVCPNSMNGPPANTKSYQ